MTTANKRIPKERAANFVDAMLKSAQDTKEVKPQTRFDYVDQKELDKLMAKLQKGEVKKRSI